VVKVFGLRWAGGMAISPPFDLPLRPPYPLLFVVSIYMGGDGSVGGRDPRAGQVFRRNPPHSPLPPLSDAIVRAGLNHAEGRTPLFAGPGPFFRGLPGASTTVFGSRFSLLPFWRSRRRTLSIREKRLNGHRPVGISSTANAQNFRGAFPFRIMLGDVKVFPPAL